MIRILKLLLVLAVIGLVALSAYAYLGDMSAVQAPVTHPVTLDVGP